ncbi:hypothetical protein AMELA_G00098950 [Ameiurus melas]|uniref:FAD-binding FR-type domain-containing protein n=1 Tax=Ameiurus melas TaxID=219545 RepID=A0A7J6AUD2_AMEME|nr:hypothetical protein AMELA_G00098950 [Ameiurus melas]
MRRKRVPSSSSSSSSSMLSLSLSLSRSLSLPHTTPTAVGRVQTRGRRRERQRERHTHTHTRTGRNRARAVKCSRFGVKLRDTGSSRTVDMGLSLKSWVTNEGGKHCVLVVWVGVSVWLFWRTFMLYCNGAQYYYLHNMLGLGLCVSRASASVLNLNCSLVLLPMCRSILTILRGQTHVSSRKVRRLLDKSKTFHVACGVAICVFSVIHVSAHLVNAVSFSVQFSDEFPDLNVAHYRGQDPRVLILTTVPGITGVLLVLILFLMFTASSHSIRVCSYEIFWYTHNLFILFYIILMLHVLGGMLKYQTNVEAHPPGCVLANQTPPTNPTAEEEKRAESAKSSSTVCGEGATFQAHFPQSWLWVSAPLCLYCAERVYRYVRGSIPVTVVSVTRHPCDVIEVRMLKSGFKPRPGQYILLNCPSVSSFENHAFTLTACPTQNKDTFGIHIRVLGDWTKCFSKLLLPEAEYSEVLPMMRQQRYPKLYVDGPFGSPSEEVFHYEVSVCVAGGIGVTPFACVLRTLLDDWCRYKLQRLYFVWLWEENRPDFLNIRLYLTSTHSPQNLTEEKYRPLSSRLLIGRPRWKLLFQEIGKANQHKKVGVFCCGPKSVSRELHKHCNSFSSSTTVFEYNKESFS